MAEGNPNVAEAPIGSERGDDVVHRPADAVYDLPVEFRWEATRRHPYYLVFWSDAAQYRRQQDQPAGTLQPEERARLLLQHAAFLMLGAIGVSGDPVDPALTFEDLDGRDDIDPAFLSGAVQPMTFRTMTVAMINALPRAELAALGAFLMNAGGQEYALDGDNTDGWQQRLLTMSRLAQIPSVAFDSYPDTPLYYIHMGASQRTITRDVEEQVRRWKERRGIGERRVHTSNLAKYLEVWDLREGWTGRGYDRREERTLAEIAQRLGISVSTVASRYRSAFQMITGHEFHPALWYRLVAPLKLSEIFNDAASILSAPMRRRRASPVRRPVPDTALNPREGDARDTGVVESESVICDDHRLTDFLIDLQDLRGRGFSDQEIAERFECGVEAIQYARDRLTELDESRSPLESDAVDM